MDGSRMSTDRDALMTFELPQGTVSSQSTAYDRWFKGESFNRMPSKADLRRDGLGGVLYGWKPAEPLIHEETRVFAMGSCFAAYFIRWLGDRGFNRSMAAPYAAFVQNAMPFENVAVVAQQFRWAFGEVGGESLLWVDPEKQLVAATEERRTILRDVLQQAEVLILTLGLSEIWYDRVTNEPLWRAVPERYFEPERHAFRVLSVAETVEHLETIERIRAEHVPHLKILYTVSPVRLTATFRPISAITANVVSKAIVRAGLDEFLRAHQEQVNSTYFYFPSFEIVSDVFRDPYDPDNRHVHEGTVAQVMDLFARQYTSLLDAEDGAGVQVADESHSPEGQLLARIGELEAEVDEGRRVSAERLEVIQGLDRAASERLDVIETLERASTERLAAIEALSQAAEERLRVIGQLDERCRRLQEQVATLEAQLAATSGQPDGNGHPSEPDAAPSHAASAG
jgi:hypothetical protein